MRRTTAGATAFLTFTGTLLVLPVYAAPLPEAEPVEASIEEVSLGSVVEPEGEAVVTQDGKVQPGGVDVPAAEAPAAPSSPTPSPEVPGEDVASSGQEVAGVPALTLSETSTEPFETVGVTWRQDPSVGEVTVQLRVAGLDGSWGEWTTLEADDAEQTDAEGTPDSDTRAGTAPYWTGESTGVEVIVQAVGGTVPQNVELALIDPGESAADALPEAVGPQDQADAGPTMPRIHTRAEWGADESIRTWDPQYVSTIKAATIHHTADSNAYAAADVPGILRSMYAYHAKTRGWGDIGYNVIVDKFGRAFEGRYGGLTSTVVGAHAGGFNSFTVGVSMLGNYDVTPVPAATVAAVSDVVAWKLGLYGVDPRGSTVLTSGGGTSKYPTGTRVTLPTIFGHRDTGSTACPGQYGYAQLPTIRTAAAQRIAEAAAHDPRGSLDDVATTPSGFTVRGWAYDPDAPTTPTAVSVTVDGTRVARVLADRSRPDVGAAFPGVGDAHGYSWSGPVANGRHTVCVSAENAAGAGQAVQLGCREIRYENAAPRYVLDEFTEQADGRVRIRGWAFDPDGSPTEIHVYDNGRGLNRRPDVARPDVAAAFPAAGPTSGFEVTLGPLSGRHEVCVFVVDTVAGGNNTLADCTTFDYAAPVGVVDEMAEAAAGGLRVRGWAYDPSTPATSIPVHVWVNGRGYSTSASGARPDVAAAVPAAGAAHGFDTVLPLDAGTHEVCVFFINAGIGGANPYQCRTVTIAYIAPQGVVDQVTPVGDGKARVRGWVFDRSVPTAPVTVHYYVDGRYVTHRAAADSRQDIARAFPGVGAFHGFDVTLDVGRGRHDVCTFAVNLGAAGSNPLFHCSTVTG